MPQTWLVARTGDHIDSVVNESRTAELPPDVPPMPRLESDIVADSLGPTVEGSWYLPEFVLLDEDPNFAFDVVQKEGEVSDEDGGPVNRATLTVTLLPVMPEHLDSPTAEADLSQVPDLDPGVSLVVPVTRDDGTSFDRRVAGSTSSFDEAALTASFELTGSLVKAVYIHLTRSGRLGLAFDATYSGYQTTLVTEPDVGFPVHGPIFEGFQFEVFGDGGLTAGAPLEPSLLDRFGSYVFFPSTARFHRDLALGLTYKTDTYRSRFTISAEGMTRPIIDGDDLDHPAKERSEFRELTTIGDLTTKYPSLRRVLFGQVTGTVIAVPAAYGILVTKRGALASCDSIVDESPASISGCRFHFTFTVGPMADPIDLARLRADVAGIPEAVGRTLRVALPGGLDTRAASTLDGFPTGKASFGAGEGTTITVGVDITDDRPTPAATIVNLFLQQLAAPDPAPLFGSIVVRLDDIFDPPVRTSLLLSLRHTAHADELTATARAGHPPTATAVNQGPLDLELLRCADVRDGQRPEPIVPLGGAVLAAGQTTTLQGVGAGTTVEVTRGLHVAETLPKAAMLKFLAFHTQTVQEVQHPLTVNAAGLNFAAEGVSSITAQITLAFNPDDPVPSLTLTPSHTVDFVHVSLPVDSAVTGLDSTVLLTVTTSSGVRTVSLAHDFIDDPILTVTSSTLH
ncbi:hypothetical protein ACFYUJ_34835 [Streptomyces sp. NPDC004520]|uniref:hypothetical protein n=1 Tax=Streptomyces sp. NPDC004520 TaxID=3364702 RepID=UPI0036AB63D1